jgi:hypothetical protein
MASMFTYTRAAVERAMKVLHVQIEIFFPVQREHRRYAGTTWKRRGVEKSESRLSHPAWKSAKCAEFPLSPIPGDG